MHQPFTRRFWIHSKIFYHINYERRTQKRPKKDRPLVVLLRESHRSRARWRLSGEFGILNLARSSPRMSLALVRPYSPRRMLLLAGLLLLQQEKLSTEMGKDKRSEA